MRRLGMSLSLKLTLAVSVALITPLATKAQDAAQLARINKALQAMPPQSGGFVQQQANGSLLRGTYHMHWPNRLRFAYGADGPVITVRKNFLAVQDAPRAEPNWLPVSLTPLALIRQAVADGVRPVMVVAFDAQPSYWALSLKDPSGDTPGQATLYFSQPDGQLMGWQLVDVQNLVTQVQLVDRQTYQSLDEAVFAVDYDSEDEE